jgi:predicted metalloprotease with PDZ domain
MRYINLVENLPTDVQEWEQASRNSIHSTGELGAGIDNTSTITGQDPLSPEQIAAIESGKLIVCVYGACVYQSIFDKETFYATDICVFYRPGAPEVQGAVALYAANKGNDVK